ncbi:hypothetical protein FI667_g8796, partial [Globisporangium splendens]
MKFPTPGPMFPDVALERDEKRRYVQLANGLVHDTLQEYDAYNGAQQQRQVSKALWKLVKARENIAVYKDRAFDSKDYLSNVHRGLASGHDLGPSSSSGSSSLSRRSSSSSSALSAAMLDSIPAEEWNLPKLLMVGTLSGTLDDVMYGLTTPDVGLMLLKAFYAQDEVIDGQVLAQIHGPTPTEPYRFLGLKWLVKGNPPAVNALVMPRDLVLLETTGILDHPSTGERIGYFLMHSVSLPQCPELPKKAAVRARISSCYIFKELSPGVVDVYMKGYVEASGRVADAVAIISAANGLLCCWKAVVCSQSKKLAWVLRTKYSEEKRRITRQSSVAEDFARMKQSSSVCGMCSKTFKMYNRVAPCQLCGEAMCSRCRVTMKLGFAQPKTKDVHLKNVTMCKGCIATTNQQSTFAIAQQEVLSGRFGSLSHSSSSSASGPESAGTSIASSSSGSLPSRPSRQPSLGTGTPELGAGNSILFGHAQDRANTSFHQSPGVTILSAHAQDQARRKNTLQKSSNSNRTGSSRAETAFASTAASDDGFFDSENEGDSADDTIQPEFAYVTDAATMAAVGEWGATSPTSRQQYLDSVQGRTPEEQEIWKRMAQLHFQAENLYQYTKKNTETLMFHNNNSNPYLPPQSSGMPRMSID